MTGTRVIVTGGAGFVGSHVVNTLVNHGYAVTVVDDLSSGKVENVNPFAKLMVLNTASDSLPGLFAKERPEYVIHLAAQVSVQASLDNPITDALSNIVGSINVFQSCQLNSVRRVVYASSAAVYGDPVYLPIDEKHPTNPKSFYGISKLVAEQYLRAYGNMYGLDYVILRYSNLYGPKQTAAGEGGVVSMFMDRMSQGMPPLVFGDGEQTRDFIHVEDVAQATVQALRHGDAGIMNVSSGEPTSIARLATLMMTAFGMEGEPELTEPRDCDIVHSHLSNAEVSAKLNWQPQLNLEDGLLRTIRKWPNQMSPLTS